MGQRTTVRFARAIIFASIFLSALGLVSPGTSWGDVVVTASHRVVSVTEVGDGTFEVTFDLTLANHGTTSLTGVTLYSIPAYFAELVPFSSTATLAAFSAGSTVNAQWTLITAYLVSAQPDERLLFFHAEGVDAFGQLVGFSVSSEEEVGQ